MWHRGGYIHINLKEKEGLREGKYLFTHWHRLRLLQMMCSSANMYLSISSGLLPPPHTHTQNDCIH